MTRTLTTYLLLLALAVARTAAAEGRTFATPEEAGAELTAALEANDGKALSDVLGAGAEEIVGQGSDPVVAANRKDVAAQGKKKIAVDRSDPKRAILLFGDDGWPVPIPRLVARARATLRESRTIKAIEGTRFAISNEAIASGDSIEPGPASRLRITKLSPRIATSATALAIMAHW